MSTSDNATELSERMDASTARRGIRGVLDAHPGIADAAIAVSYVVVLLPGLVHAVLFPDPADAWQAPIALAATIGNGAALLLRRRAPIVALVASIVLVLGVKSVLCGTLDPLGLALAGYAAGAHLPPRRAWIALPTSVVLVIVVITVGAPLSPATAEIDSLLIIDLVLMVPACLLGLLMRARSSLRASEERRLLQERHEREQQAELAAVRTRTTLSREMHDVVGHSLTAIINISDGALRVSDARPEVSAESLRQINQLARNALGETRSILGTLRPDGQTAPLTPAPVPRALPPTGGSLDDAGDAGLGIRELLATAASTGLATHLIVQGNPPPHSLSDEARIAAHRIVQEAITNAMRHAQDASSIAVTITHAADNMMIQVHDDGANAPQVRPGNGLRGAAERATTLGGHLHSGPAPSGGWHVTAVLPHRRTEL